MPSSLLDDGRPAFALDWMSHLRTSLPEIDFGPSHDGAPDLSPYARTSDRYADMSSPRRQAPSKSIPQRRERPQHDAHAWPAYHHAMAPSSAIIDDVPTAHTQSSHHKGRDDLVCWDHGCNGRVFTTSSNLARHRREHSEKRPTYHCPKCGAYFSRKTARNTHVENDSCSRIRRYSNGRERPKLRK